MGGERAAGRGNGKLLDGETSMTVHHPSRAISHLLELMIPGMAKARLAIGFLPRPVKALTAMRARLARSITRLTLSFFSASARSKGVASEKIREVLKLVRDENTRWGPCVIFAAAFLIAIEGMGPPLCS